MNKLLDATEKFIIMCDIEKRAMEIFNELQKTSPCTECHNIVGYKMNKKNWKDAKEAGFKKEADGRWIGFTKSFGGNGGNAETAYLKALKEKIEEFLKVGVHTSFLDNVFIYEYLV